MQRAFLCTGYFHLQIQDQQAKPMSQELQGQIRTIIAFLGGLAVNKGWIDEQTMLALAGAVVTIIASVWSWKSKAKKSPNLPTR